MHLVSTRPQQVRVGALGLDLALRAGETIHTENCYKHSQEGMKALLARHGLRVEGTYASSEPAYCLFLAS